jgi:ABC-type Fe3+-hydroxamate transport system substrate-binding protein
VDQLRADGFEVIEFAPHDFDDAFELCRSLGARLVGPARARAFEHGIARELAQIGAQSFQRPRPRVLAVLDVAPLVVAGGHSFATDLIEIAGGSSVTHELEERRIELTLAEIEALAPDRVLLIRETAWTDAERDAARLALLGAAQIFFFSFDFDGLWMRDAVDAARRLRALIEPLSRE